jgi:hypothetical protein
MISQMLTGQFSVAEPDKTLVEMVEGTQSRRDKMKRSGFIIMWVGMVVAALLGVVGGAMTNINWAIGNFIASLAGIGGIILLVGVGLMIYSRFLPKVSVQRPSPQPTALPPVEPPVNLPPERRPEQMPSVTEHTTVRLEAPEYEPPRQVLRESKE